MNLKRKYNTNVPSQEFRDMGKLFASHVQEDADNFKAIRETLDRIDGKLTPIADSYMAATTMGKWIMGFLVFVSIIVGIIAALRGVKLF